MSYLHGFYLNYFQTTKRHSYDGYSIYISIFNSFFQGVYPVGVTELRPYCTHIIGHNSVNVYRIPTKVDTEIRLNEPFTGADPGGGGGGGGLWGLKPPPSYLGFT